MRTWLKVAIGLSAAGLLFAAFRAGVWYASPMSEPLKLCVYSTVDPGYVEFWNLFIDLCQKLLATNYR